MRESALARCFSISNEKGSIGPSANGPTDESAIAEDAQEAAEAERAPAITSRRLRMKVMAQVCFTDLGRNWVSRESERFYRRQDTFV